MSGVAHQMRYSTPALRRDYWRGGAGLAMSLAMLLLVTPWSAGFYVILGFVGVFGAFAANTFLKQSTLIELDESGVTRRLSGPAGKILRTRRIAFDALDRFSLRYYGRRRDKGRGIVEVTLGAGKTSLTADHALEDFDALVKRAHNAAIARNVGLDASTEANLRALGYR